MVLPGIDWLNRDIAKQNRHWCIMFDCITGVRINDEKITPGDELDFL